MVAAKMNPVDDLSTMEPGAGAEQAPPSRLGIALLIGGALTLVLAGLLLWWREGDRLFTDGLIAAIVACF
ncbi:hypothetical protein IP69_09795 [Bosea sp. AAP35]|uniref:hypothetical protein n=1 Tax=Bosea sp. AAP35 TaxID=1523417 RepID=UPI0006B8E537|nr:hypothetical protein [Bosea sp. AAP35]KPF70150.1 hypothetical protein IP69_09795 [Bosea sp. AAP35]